jgi:hypothetical protein
MYSISHSFTSQAQRLFTKSRNRVVTSLADGYPAGTPRSVLACSTVRPSVYSQLLGEPRVVDLPGVQLGEGGLFCVLRDFPGACCENLKLLRQSIPLFSNETDKVRYTAI